MSDPGTCLAIVSLALQVSKGLLGYYDLWTHADEDVAEIQRSLLALANIFTQLEITLGKPNLSEDLISIIRITMKGCDSNVKKLELMLGKVKREGAPEKLRTKFRNFNRRMLQMFQHGEIMRVQSVLNELREDLNMVVSLLSLNTTATSLDDLRKVHADLTTLQNSNTERIEMEKEKNREARKRALIEWLAAPDIAAAHLSAQDQKEEGTGEWFLESQEFLEWANTGRSMWLAGDVGCGKTVLCSSVIEELKSRAPQRGDHIAYFYFTFSDTNHHGITGFLKSMLQQLCLTGFVDTLMEALHQRCGLDPPSTRQMQATLLAYLERVCASKKDADMTQEPQVYIILDGLDEIPYGPDRTKLLRLLSQIAEKTYPLLHALVSSRPERDIEREILGNCHWSTFPYSSDGVRDDLAIYVANQIKLTPKLASLPDHTKEEIHEKLVTGSGGMFRWTALQMQELKKKRILRGRDVQNILSSLPKSLDATYERVLLQIDQGLVYEAKTALQWLSCCLRPLYLEELVDASIVDPDQADPFDEEFRISPFDLVELLPGLIKVIPSPDPDVTAFVPRHYTVTLAHFSVKEYLVSSRMTPSLSHTYTINLELAHRHVVRSSLAYIGYCLSTGSSNSHQQNHVDDFPLQLYAYSRWEMHAQLGSRHLNQDWASVLEIFRQPAAALMWCACSSVSRQLGEESPVYNIGIPFQAFSFQGWPMYYLLCRAIVSTNESLVRAILDSGLDLTNATLLGNPFPLALVHNCRISASDMPRGRASSLTSRSLSRSAHESIPRMLLEFGYRPTASDLLLAVRHGSTRLLSLMLEQIENIMFPDISEALEQAAASRRPQIAHILMQHLLSGTPFHPKKPLCNEDEARKANFDLIFTDAVEKGSLHLVSYLMDSTAGDLVDQLDVDKFLLRAVVNGRYQVAATIRQKRGRRLSENSLLSAQRWQGLMVSDELALALLVMFASRCHTPKLQLQTWAERKRLSKTLIQPYVHGLGEETVDRVLQVWLKLDQRFEPLNQQDPFIRDIPTHMSMTALSFRSTVVKLFAFLSLSSRHSPSIHDLCCQAVVLRYHLRPLTKTRNSSPTNPWEKLNDDIEHELKRLHNALVDVINDSQEITSRSVLVSLGPNKGKQLTLKRESCRRSWFKMGQSHMEALHTFFFADSDGQGLGFYHLISRLDFGLNNSQAASNRYLATDVYLYRDILTIEFSVETGKMTSGWYGEAVRLLTEAGFLTLFHTPTSPVEPGILTGSFKLMERQLSPFSGHDYTELIRDYNMMELCVRFLSTLLRTHDSSQGMRLWYPRQLLPEERFDIDSWTVCTEATLMRVVTRFASSNLCPSFQLELFPHGDVESVDDSFELEEGDLDFLA